MTSPTSLSPLHALDPQHASQGTPSRQPAPAPSPAAELAAAQITLKSALRQYPDFPSPGILFEDISPLFGDPKLHALLIDSLVKFVESGPGRPDVIVALDARGFYIGPSLALRFNVGFVPVRKRGKLPGKTLNATYTKEYGEDFLEMQVDAIKEGQKVLIVDDIIATGGTAAAAGELVQKLGGTLLGFVFMLELRFLKGRDKLKAPVYTLLSGQE